MKTKTFTAITSLSMALTITAAVLSIIGISITGLYLGIVVLCMIALIPIASKLYAKQMINKASNLQRNYYTPLVIINVLSMLVVLWMTFVILVDRVFSKVL
jgi:hypothetical protein